MEESLRNTPFYFGVPKNQIENLLFREALLELADEDPEFRLKLWIASKRDVLFWVNTFAWVFEPRDSVILPFITWDFQDRVFLTMDDCIGRTDFGMEKSRDMGASWMFLTIFFYRWLFRSRQTFGLVSRTEDACDKKDDPDTLFWKLDFHWENLPWWMRPERERVRLSMRNCLNNSVLTGYSATSDVARGGRKTAFGMDELSSWGIDNGFNAWASTQHVTNSRIVVSTPQGMSGIFAEVMQKKDSAMVKYSVHWSDHPEKSLGLYRSTDGNLEIIDESYKFPPDYQFILDGKLRSPWYDQECRRHPVPALIAQELDIDYAGSGHPFFNAKIVKEHSELYGCTPFMRGELHYSTEDHEPTWFPNKSGRLLLWLNLTVAETPPQNVNYVIGCDIATGTGGEYSTNSVASVVNRLSGEKVAELSVNDLYPDKFADYVVALRKWFQGPDGDAFVIWESNGPGAQFGKHFMSVSGYRVYYRQSETSNFAKPSKNPGWFSAKTEKRILLGEYAKAIERGSFVNRSLAALDEMYHYIHFPDGSVDHDRAKSSLDPTASGENHGDRVIADALACRAIGSTYRQKATEDNDISSNPPYNSLAWRMLQHQKQAKLRDSWL